MKLTTSAAWRWEESRDKARLVHVPSGAGLEFSGDGVALMRRFWRQASRSARQAELVRALSGLGPAQSRQLVADFRERGVLRPRGAVPVRGVGALAAALRAEIGPLRGFREVALGGRPPRHGVVAVEACGGALLAMPGGQRACVECLRLRWLGAVGEPGQDQRRAATPRAPKDGWAPAAAALGFELRRARLSAEHGVVVPPQGAAFRTAVVPHPDCPVCAGGGAKRVAAICRALRAGAPSAPKPGSMEALRDAPLAPMNIQVVPAPRGHYPLDAPLVWGSLRLTRQRGDRLRCMSTLGGVYGKGPDLQTCLRLATSEGCERLAAMGARPDVQGRGSELEAAVPLRELYSWASPADERRRRGFVWGLDLHSGRPALLPLEAIAVGLPRDLYPEAIAREPFFSGTASHRTFAEAVVHATLELLERDAFMITWYRGRALPRVRWPARPSALARRRARYLEERGVRLELFDLRLQISAPALLLRATATRARGNWPRGGALLCASSSFSAAVALERALGLACGQYVSVALQPAPEKDPLDVAAVERLAARTEGWRLLARYLDPKRRSAHAFLGRGQIAFEELRGREPRDGAAAMRVLGGWLREAGLGWYAARLTDEAMAAAGFEVAKVVIPGLLRLAPTREAVDLGQPRLRRNWPLATMAEPNPEPHPVY